MLEAVDLEQDLWQKYALEEQTFSFFGSRSILLRCDLMLKMEWFEINAAVCKAKGAQYKNLFSKCFLSPKPTCEERGVGKIMNS